MFKSSPEVTESYKKGLVTDLERATKEILRETEKAQVVTKSAEHGALHRLCYSVERIFSHGVKSSIWGKSLLWDFVASLDQCLPGSTETIEYLKECCTTPTGRARSFILLGLNEKALQAYTKALIWNQKVSTYYLKKWAVLRCPTSTSKILLLFAALESIDFNLDCKDRDLDFPNYWNKWGVNIQIEKPKKRSSVTLKRSNSILSLYTTAGKDTDDTSTVQTHPPLKPVTGKKRMSVEIVALKQELEKTQLEKRLITSQYETMWNELQDTNDKIRELEEELHVYKAYFKNTRSISPPSERREDGEPKGSISPDQLRYVLPEYLSDEEGDDGEGTEMHQKIIDIHQKGKNCIQELKRSDQHFIRSLSKLDDFIDDKEVKEITEEPDRENLNREQPNGDNHTNHKHNNTDKPNSENSDNTNTIEGTFNFIDGYEPNLENNFDFVDGDQQTNTPDINENNFNFIDGDELNEQTNNDINENDFDFIDGEQN